MAKQPKIRYIDIEGHRVGLAPREFDLYKILEELPTGEFLTAEELEARVTGEVLPNNPGHWTRIYVQRLRKRLEETGANKWRYIRNVYSRGYYLWKPDHPVQEPDTDEKGERRDGTDSGAAESV